MDATPRELRAARGKRRAARLPRHLLGFAIFLLAVPAAAQWSTQSPVPTHLHVGGVAAPAAGRVFLATADDPFDDGGALFESTDGGATWVQRDVPFSLFDGLAGIFFLDEVNGWTWGNVNYRTTDGGATWVELPFLGSTYFMEFYTASFGLATGNFGAAVSGDGGLTWEPAPHDMTAFDFADDLTGLGAADTGLYRTDDGGVTFTPVHAGAAEAVTFLQPTVAVGIADDAFVRSTDGGVTWTVGAAAEGRSRLLAVSADVVLAWGRSGAFPDYDDRIFRSSDAGQTWTDLGEVIDPGPFAAPFAFAVPAADTVVASDGAGNMYHSADAGQTWAQAFQTPGPVPSLTGGGAPAFADAESGYFGFGAGFLIATADGGASWTQLSSGSAKDLNDMDRFPGGDLVAVGADGAVMTSAGGGMPWVLRQALTAEELEAVHAIGPQEVVAVDRSGVLYRSADAGATWTVGGAIPPEFFVAARDLRFASLLEGWVIGVGHSGAALFHTADGGVNWTPVPDFQGSYFALDFEGSSGWAAAVNGVLQRTVDGGVTWIGEQLPGSSLAIQDLDFSDAGVGYAVGASNVTSGYAAKSGDGGVTWQILPLPDGVGQLTDLYLIGPDELWVSTAAGAALYSATGGQNWAVLDAGAAGLGSYSTIAASPSGDAWMAGWRGTIRRFSGPPPPPVNWPPVASFDFVTTGLSVAFTDTSTDPDGTVVGWLWDFGDDTTSSEQNPTHVFPAADTYIVTLTVTDDDGDTGADVEFIVVQPGPGGVFGDFTEVTPLDPLFVTPQDEDFWVSTTAAADYDGDGDLDIAVLGYYVVYNTSVEERLVLLRNDGPAGPEEWEFAYVDVPLGTLTSGASDLAWGDADGDGDQDLAVGSDGQTVIYRNDAGTLVASDTVLPPYLEDNDQADFDLRSITWADYDNDGDVDLLLPSVWDDATLTYRTSLMRNDGADGTGGFSFTEVTPFAPTAHAQSAWADDDGDQDLDLLLVHLAPLTEDGFIRRYRNDGAGVFAGEDVLGSLTIEHGEAQWGDYDDDGDLDILVAGHIRELDGSFNTVLRIYRNDAGTYAPFEVIACPACEGWWDLTAATWADYDSDGDVDILLAGTYNSGSQIEGRAKVYDNEGGTFVDSGNELPAPRGAGSRGGTFGWLDLDGDGDLDYFIAGEYFVPGGNGLVEAQMHVYRNDVDGQNAAPAAPTGPISQVDGNGTVMLWWNPASDDLTPSHALTYDLRLYRDGAPASAPDRLPEPGGVSAVSQWTLTGLTAGNYTWTLQAVDSAYNSSLAAEATFIVGGPDPNLIFTDGFESGNLSPWSAVFP